jgi:5-methylcytosine-specific restriction endonuclease McrA
MYRRFGSVSAALKRAGVEQVSHGRRYTEDEIFENLLNVWTHFGRPPAALEMDQLPSTVGKNAYIHRYGGWRKALKAFVERANSEADDNPTPDSERHPSTATERTEPTGSPATVANSSPKVGSQTNARSRVPRNTATTIRPEDRRDPSIGLRFKVLKRDLFKCVLCGDHPARNAECILHVDHVIPWSKGGKTREDNLRTLCATCNVGRGNRFTD